MSILICKAPDCSIGQKWIFNNKIIQLVRHQDIKEISASTWIGTRKTVLHPAPKVGLACQLEINRLRIGRALLEGGLAFHDVVA
jgi:hypothetical protein